MNNSANIINERFLFLAYERRGKLNKTERLKTILNILQDEHTVDVKDLASRLSISDMTVRRDLNYLSSQYNITRIHGGAMLDSGTIINAHSFNAEKPINMEQKEKIARAAAGMIANGQRILIDAGSTCRQMMRYMNDAMQNVIVTNHLQVVEDALCYENLSVIMLGGEIVKSKRCTTGVAVEEQLSKYPVDIAFIGAAAVGADGNLFDEYSPDSFFKKQIFSNANKVVLLVDSSKIISYQLSSFGSLDHVDTVVTDSGVSEAGKELFNKYGVEMIIV